MKKTDYKIKWYNQMRELVDDPENGHGLGNQAFESVVED